MNSVEIHQSPPEDFKFDVHVSACYLKHQCRYLFLKKAPYWTLPAGKMEEGETPRDAVIREVREEAGICLSSHPLIKVGQLYIRKPDCDFAFTIFHTELKEKIDVKLSKEHTDFDWMLEEEIPTLPLMPGGREVFEYFKICMNELQGRKILLACYLFLRKENQILLSLRKNTGFADDQFGLVSGHVEKGESAKAAMIREALEEAGIKIDFNDLKLAHVSHFKSNTTYVNFFFECQNWKEEVRNLEPHKCGGLQFFSIESLPSNMVPHVKNVIDQMLRGEICSEEGFSIE